MPDDITLQAMVMDELAFEPSVDAAHIGVSAKNGVITLTGFVNSYTARAAAEQAASRVRGVQAIAQEIEVRLPNDQKHADDEIAERALRILAWDIEVPEKRIQVTVSHGVVTLSGEVDHYFQRAAAESDVRRLGGVLGVINRIRLSPEAVSISRSGIVRQKIEDALRRSADVEASRIDVQVEGGTVSLEGAVRSWSERSLVRSAAWSAPGVTEVRDHLRIVP
ncbi:MAG TPA: BON domain-containing protein [Rhodopila sp.]|nr:BON domain-containing protein [Rhodopila sp.]